MLLGDRLGEGRLAAYLGAVDRFCPDADRRANHPEISESGANRAAGTLALLAGSPWEVTDPGRQVVHDAVERSFAPFVHDGLLMDTVRGRAATRQSFSDAVAGHALIDAVLVLAGGAPEPYRSRFRGLAKGWIERCSVRPYLEHADVPATARAARVLDDPGVPAVSGPVGHFVFPAMDRVVHRRPGWSYAIGMSSRRVAAYEAINGENPHGWYTGDGMTYLYTGDLGQFGRDFWPTVNPCRLPGTTVDTRPREDLNLVAKCPSNAWAGGAALVGRYGAACLEVIGDGVPMRARKSWFCLDSAVVALGSGITGPGRLVTVMENRATEAEPYVADGWAHVEGAGGHVFEGAPLSLVETRTGRWRDINAGDDTSGAAEPVSRRYVTFWFDHGVDPRDASYAYALLPDASRERTRAFHLRRPVRILANTPDVQAVEAGGLRAATFWSAGTAGGIAADDTVTVTPGERPTVTVRLTGSAGRTHATALSVPDTPRYGR